MIIQHPCLSSRKCCCKRWRIREGQLKLNFDSQYLLYKAQIYNLTAYWCAYSNQFWVTFCSGLQYFPSILGKLPIFSCNNLLNRASLARAPWRFCVCVCVCVCVRACVWFMRFSEKHKPNWQGDMFVNSSELGEDISEI